MKLIASVIIVASFFVIAGCEKKEDVEMKKWQENAKNFKPEKTTGKMIFDHKKDERDRK